MLHSSDGLAVVEGLNNDAPIGTLLSFVTGALGSGLLDRISERNVTSLTVT